MTRRWILIVIAANLIGLAALAFVYPHLMVSPGALVPAHAGLASDCFACHAPFRGASPERCVTCHAVSDIGIRTTQGAALANATAKPPFHQQLIAQDCMACHSDHPAPALARGTRPPFSHAMLRPTVRDRCEACHAPPADAIHRDGGAACGQCHSADHWKPATFDHGKFFRLDGHHNTTCATCHVDNDYRRYTCYGCHEHDPAKVRAKHLEEGIGNFENCVQCHRNSGEKHGGRHSGDGQADD